VAANRLHVIENWPDHELLDEHAAAPGEIHITPAKRPVRHDPVEAKFRVLYAGNIGRAHPLDTVIAAARILSRGHRDIEFAFAGKGAGYDRLAQTRARLALDMIRLIPAQPRNRLKLMMESGDAHLVVMDERAKGLLLPCKVYSALAVGRPVIFVGPEDSEIGRMIKRHKCGIIVRQGDAQGLADAVLALRNDADAWFAAVDGARAALVSRTPGKAYKAWDNLIARLA